MENKKRLIYADDFLADLKEYHDSIMCDPEIGKEMKWRESVCFGNAVNVLVRQPTVDAVPVVHGRWEAFKNTAVRCSECKLILSDICGECFSYCPNCGAKMDGGKHGI